MSRNSIQYKIKSAMEVDILMHLRECNQYFFPPLTERVNIEQYSHKLYEKSVTFEAWKNSILVGLIAAYIDKQLGELAFITNVSVLSEFAGLGIASELLGKCIQYAIKNSIKEILLEVNEDNLPAINLYHKFKFKDLDVNNKIKKMKLILGDQYK